MRMLARNRRGDTIVEVLLAIVVVSSTLGAAFATMNKGVQGTRASQERAEALKFVEEQTELLKAGIEQSVSGIFTSSETFCMQIDGGGALKAASAKKPGVSDAGFDIDAPLDDGQDFGHYAAQCIKGTVPYHVSITRIENPPDSGSYTFTVRAHWDRIGGDHRDRIEMKYKASP